MRLTSLFPSLGSPPASRILLAAVLAALTLPAGWTAPAHAESPSAPPPSQAFEIRQKAAPQDGEEQGVYAASYRTLVGEGESLEEARQICRENAIRAAIDRAGVLVAPSSGGARLVAATLVRVEEARDTLVNLPGGRAVDCVVRVRVEHRDEESLVRKDTEGRARPAQDSGGAAGDMAALLARERAEKSSQAMALISPGMAMADVAALLGEPLARLPENEHGYACERHGDVWIVSRQETVQCLRSRLRDEPGLGLCHCRGLSSNVLKR